MSQVNIKGLIENIRERANVYTPIIEAIVNAIESIEAMGRKDGKVIVTVKRELQEKLQLETNSLPDIVGITIEDNGVGFNKKNRDSFDTVFSDLKTDTGGKGFGRFMFLKFFDRIKIESMFAENGSFHKRSFYFGNKKKIIENEKIDEIDSIDTKTIIYLDSIIDRKLEKKLETLARKLVEKLLIYFIGDRYICPQIILKDESNKQEIVLNDFVGSAEHSQIQEVESKGFTLTKNGGKRDFIIKIFKLLYPNNQKSKIILTAHNREVTETLLHNYIPEFEDEFYEQSNTGARNDYFLRSYVLGDYLNENVLLERDAFKFSRKDDEIIYPFSQVDIEKEAAVITKNAFPKEIESRQKKKIERIQQYVDLEAPWLKSYIKDIDLTNVPFKVSDQDIEIEIHKIKFDQEYKVKGEVRKILANPNPEINENVSNIINQISQAEMSELAHYIALRKTVLELFKKSLEIKPDGKHELESTVHKFIFPTKADSDNTPYDNHNLWIIDEKLNFTEYISSDLPLNKGKSERPDILIYSRKIAFRGENESHNPITIFEFKKPQRDDFTDPSSKEDPVEQIIRYVNGIKDGKFKTRKGRDILIAENTPFYGYVVCDLTPKVKEWLKRVKDFKPMPDGEGWFQYYSNNNLYIEVLSWDKLIKDAEMRNKIFFKKLGII